MNYRWIATVTYDTKSGPTDVVHYVEEMEDVHSLVERGPNFYLIDSVVIRPNVENPDVRDLIRDARDREREV